ncbi:cytochrome d ubiquinol oxidase subunit II [Actinoplanes derwentensis]|uniref:Cytochrome bd-I ubiquinol oxidase subunit 2 apoprotein n=1 Tax=Actinoplanes derwentensis TaxID=113562 RepID=A0A1H1ZR44_9ACTN|nr:cytochrome d ubiquinol oxidase subunit II [Actinoplanes derwentensis]GID89165.1 cytochrome c oxidase assembly protein [Actinoplanes derwentensis]SDT36047.1 cytochrome bd-I ubiquinol oxidase subunit 2 apoprotein [Actinoplanes derwentensis]
MELTTVWFILIGVLWAGYFLLEGFDFGVGILLPVLGRDDRSRRLAINTIGPVWDGNEVWLLVAGGATFAAFPEWYATLFSGFYLPLLLILVALIVRGVAFEYRHKRDGARWKQGWDLCIFWGSLVPAILWGVAFGNILRGVPIDGRHEYVGGFVNLLNPYALLGGLTTLALFTLHGAVFLALKTDGPMRAEAGRLAARLALVAVPIAAGFLLWTGLVNLDGWGIALSVLAAAALLGAVWLTRIRREGWAFTATGATILFAVAALFITLFPNVMPSSLDAANNLTVLNASSTPYTLKVMTWVAVAFTPIVLIYQGWTYWVFRKRLKLSDIPA